MENIIQPTAVLLCVYFYAITLHSFTSCTLHCYYTELVELGCYSSALKTVPRVLSIV